MDQFRKYGIRVQAFGSDADEKHFALMSSGSLLGGDCKWAQIYRLADPPPNGDKSIYAIRHDFRVPKKGEWYLSGAIPEAYQAKGDLSSPYHVVRLVRIETRQISCFVGYVEG